MKRITSKRRIKRRTFQHPFRSYSSSYSFIYSSFFSYSERDHIAATEVVRTVIGGRIVYAKKE